MSSKSTFIRVYSRLLIGALQDRFIMRFRPPTITQGLHQLGDSIEASPNWVDFPVRFPYEFLGCYYPGSNYFKQVYFPHLIQPAARHSLSVAPIKYY